MISLSELKSKALRRYDTVLRGWLSAENIFPMLIPANKKIDKTKGWEYISEQQKGLLLHSKNKTGQGYWLNFKENKKTRQSEITQIVFENQQDFLIFIDKTEEFEIFKEDAIQVLTEIPALRYLFIKSPQLIIQNHSKWPFLLLVCHYFIANPQPNLYIRNLPIAVHTKFIETNQIVIRQLLDCLIIEKINESETDFYKRFTLQIEEPSIKIRFLDESISFHPSVSCISLWSSEFNILDLPCQNVFIIENLASFLSFPEQANSIAIFGGGFGVSLLKNASWLNERKLFYWGDIDVHGFQILSQIRSYFSKIQSMMMDEKTFLKYYQNQKGSSFISSKLAFLTKEESLLHQKIEATNNRLEQEKITIDYILKFISDFEEISL